MLFLEALLITAKNMVEVEGMGVTLQLNIQEQMTG